MKAPPPRASKAMSSSGRSLRPEGLRRPVLSRAGNAYGSLTVLEDRGTMLLCRCSCERVGLYPSSICKPTYKGRKMCAHCAGNPCEVCGKWIEAKPGRRAATCSDACRKIRAAKLESERYARVKDTDAWQETRRAYLLALKSRRTDPDFDAAFRKAAAAHTARHTAKLNADPATREAYLKRKREDAAAWRAARIAEPARYAGFLQKCRDWYHRLSPADRERIYYAPRRKAAAQSPQA